jgi:hypothetical protein
MSSTRSKNTQGDYALETNINVGQLQYYNYSEYGVPSSTYFPGLNLITGRIASENLSTNSCDIESQLLGIGSTNLIDPQIPVVPHIKELLSVDNGKKIDLVMPAEFVEQPSQRPFRGN